MSRQTGNGIHIACLAISSCCLHSGQLPVISGFNAAATADPLMTTELTAPRALPNIPRAGCQPRQRLEGQAEHLMVSKCTGAVDCRQKMRRTDINSDESRLDASTGSVKVPARRPDDQCSSLVTMRRSCLARR